MSTDTASNSPEPPPRSNCERREACVRRWLWWIVGLGLLLRVVAAVGLQYQLDHRWQREFLIEGDANGYWELGQRLARGESFQLYEPPRRVLRMPGFPAVIAASIRMFGDHKFAARLLLAVVCSAGIPLCYWLGTTLHSAETGLIAAGLTAIAPVLIAFSPVLLTESLFAVLMLSSLACAVPLGGLLQSREKSPQMTVVALWSVLTGVMSALAVYVKPSWILAVPGFCVLLLLLARQRGTALFCSVLIMTSLVLALLPWGLRNQRVSGHFTLTTFWMGPSLYDGLNPDATGDSDMTFFDRDGLMNSMSEYEVDRHYRKAALEFVKQHPGRTLELVGIKFARYWNPWPNAPQFTHPTVRIATSLAFLPLLLLAIYGGWEVRQDRWLLVLTVAPILYFCALHCVFVSSLRYRLPGEYPLMVLAAIGLQTLWRTWRGTLPTTGINMGQPSASPGGGAC
ncbi:MAG: phospholipid carrier-dependent glycosyltransferase [Planctomycetaceae bacterium]|nr:phospholipid carrier-dependent glycosyltransferase [Planctomycetaceae bacterium]